MTSVHAPLNPRFALTDHLGRPTTEKDFQGYYQLIFFGFTNCRAVCPRALTKLSGILDALGPLATSIAPLYISVDPDRDTPEVMRTFLEERYPHFLGLTGNTDDVEAARSTFKVFAARAQDPEDPGGYAVPHSALTYVLDQEGHYLTHFLDSVESEHLEAQLREIVTSGAKRPDRP